MRRSGNGRVEVGEVSSPRPELVMRDLVLDDDKVDFPDSSSVERMPYGEDTVDD